MQIVHGTWIPQETEEFSQNGDFYLWVETDTPQSTPGKVARDTHPRHLMGSALEAFLSESLGIRSTGGTLLSHSFVSRYFALPSTDHAPLPSVELLKYMEEETPTEAHLQTWQISCYQVQQPIPSLNEIHFIALHKAEDFQLGSDLLFWYHYSQALKGIFAKDHYIPALHYRELAPFAKTKKKGATPGRFDLFPGWELISEGYEAAIQHYIGYMPYACTTGTVTPHPPTMRYAKSTLLRHFSECLLYRTVMSTPFTGKFEQQINYTLLQGCIFPHRPNPFMYYGDDPLELYTAWATWRRGLTTTQTETGFTLCFRLEEAPADDIDHWQVHFLAAAKPDPTPRQGPKRQNAFLKIGLEEYWTRKQSDRKQLQQHLGSDFEKHLLLALGHAARIYPKIWDGMDTDQPIGFPLTLEEAFTFLKEDAWVLEEAGYTVIVPSWYTPQGRRRARMRLKTSTRSAKSVAAARQKSHFSLDTIVDYQYELSIGGQVVTEEEWRQLVAAKTPLVQFRGQWVELDREKMQEMLEFWRTQGDADQSMSLADLLKVAAESGDDLEWDHDQAMQEMMANLQDKSALTPLQDPTALQGALRPYQQRGVAWLRYLESLGLHPCLADDMGLGKTVQVIARLLNEQDEQGASPPTLLVAPTSVLGNWRKEIERFAPNLRVIVHHGSARQKSEREFKELCGQHDVVITSYPLIRLDEKLMRSQEWHRVVVDEAQNIKNPQSAQTRAVLKLSARHRLALTGTPVENRLLDLWSIFNFLNPGYLGKEAQFRKTFETPIQKENNVARSTALKKLVEPFILRRVKTDKSIIDDLPDKVEQKVYCTLTTEQASLYEAVVKDVTEQLDNVEGIQRKGLILATLTRLKQVCNHPAQFLQDGSPFTPERSHKLAQLSQMVEQVLENDESLLIFTQYTEIGEALERHLGHTHHYNTHYLHGGTSRSKRERMITEFQDPEGEPSVFILSLRAGGVGITLTKANHVFHFDRWWNPAVEDQATDRAFRIGQRKNVFVHKFLALGTLEERIDQMIDDKKRLASAIVGADESWLTELDNETFKQLIALQRSSVLE